MSKIQFNAFLCKAIEHKEVSEIDLSKQDVCRIFVCTDSFIRPRDMDKEKFSDEGIGRIVKEEFDSAFQKFIYISDWKCFDTRAFKRVINKRLNREDTDFYIDSLGWVKDEDETYKLKAYTIDPSVCSLFELMYYANNDFLIYKEIMEKYRTLTFFTISDEEIEMCIGNDYYFPAIDVLPMEKLPLCNDDLIDNMPPYGNLCRCLPNIDYVKDQMKWFKEDSVSYKTLKKYLDEGLPENTFIHLYMYADPREMINYVEKSTDD